MFLDIAVSILLHKIGLEYASLLKIHNKAANWFFKQTC